MLRILNQVIILRQTMACALRTEDAKTRVWRVFAETNSGM